MSRLFLIGFLLALAVALALRVPQLDLRPMHNDEAVNAIKFGQLWEKGTYRYDPNEHHGPTLGYATWALGSLTGAPDFNHYSENRLRLVPLLFGLGLMLLLPLLTDALGRRGTAWAALFTAVSPALVFYSRYYIHETLLVCFTFLALAAAWRYWRSRRLGWALLAGAGLGLMQATKETFVLTLAATGLALCLNQVWNRLIDASGPPVKAPRLNPWHLAAGAGTWALVAVLLFSSFFTNPAGPLDSLRTYVPWLNRAGGASPHIYPWHFYLHRLLWFHPAPGPVWSELPIFLLALVAAWAGFVRHHLGQASASFVRFLTFYTFLLTAFYSLIAYKTPWCLLGFWHGMVLLAGVGAAVLLRSLSRWPLRFGSALLLLAGTGYLAWLAWQADVPLAADRRNPYVFAQTSPNLLKLVEKVESLAAAHPQKHQLVVKVICPDSDYWPLPWYLRQFKQTGWWEQLPADPYAPVMVVSSKLQAGLDEKKTHLMVGYFELRPDVFLELYVQLDLWRAWLERHPPAKED